MKQPTNHQHLLIGKKISFGTDTCNDGNILGNEIGDLWDFSPSQINGQNLSANNLDIRITMEENGKLDSLGSSDGSNNVFVRDGNNIPQNLGSRRSLNSDSVGSNDAYFTILGAATVSSTVVTNTNDSGTGSLRYVIATAKSGDVITFAANLANKTITLTGGEIAIAAGKNLIIEGANAANLTISGNNNSRIFRPLSNVNFQTALTIRNLTLANGFSNDRGGAIQTEDLGSLTVKNVIFKNNVATNGGASIWTNSRSGGVTVIDSRFENNRAISGNNERGAGGIAFVGFAPNGSSLVVQSSDFIGNQGINGAAINVINGKVTIEGSRFINNNTTAAFFATGKPRDFLRGFGGALYIDRLNDSLIIRNSKFEGNRAEGEGGAAYLFADPEDKVTIENTVFRDNQVAALTGGGNKGNGGAINHVRNSLNAVGSLTITNSSFVNNVANNQGGGLWVNNTNSTIRNSTFSNNRAPNNFGGALTTYSPLKLTNVTIVNNSAKFSGALAQGSNNLATVQNTIFSNNTSTDTGVSFNRNQQTNRPMKDGGGNLQFPNGPKLFPGILIANPNLGVIQEANGILVHPLQSGSGAIDAGINAGAPATDQRGELRPQDGDGNGSAIVDIGAFELSAIKFGTSGSDTLNGTPFDDHLIGLAGNDLIDGKDGKDTLIGGAGNDTLSGGTGADSMVGGTGNDLYGVDNIGDRIVELANQGIDTVNSSITYTLGANLENLTLTGTSNINGTGNTLNNRMTGNSVNNRLSGGTGNDTLIGGAGNDTLVGGTGNDTLTGGSGNDFFRFNSPNEGVDRITDFNLIDDTILISRSGFGGSLPLGVLSPNRFRVGSSATTSAHRFFYNSSNRGLFFDIDGNGATGAVQIATLNTSLALTNADIVVI